MYFTWRQLGLPLTLRRALYIGRDADYMLYERMWDDFKCSKEANIILNNLVNLVVTWWKLWSLFCQIDILSKLLNLLDFDRNTHDT